MLRMLFGLGMLAVILNQCAITESVASSMFDPQNEALNREYLTSARVDNALERCVRMLGVESSRGMAGASGQLDRLRECMLREFAGKLSPNHWNIV
ncbi:hypothetical protein FBUS_04300 [Fasciolopsis buskii]|uniref:Uncharacterized protein n=1 Tax=Fasciolopsis buskii TaxID=27845 RepID=A0A8E0RPA4_9TREM|nr:hypothetical protein FBUS_04300 [Fasciolopsis buski]